MYFSFTRVIEKCSVWLVCVIQDLGCDFVYLDWDFNCQEAWILYKNCVPRGAILGLDFIKLGTQFMP